MHSEIVKNEELRCMDYVAESGTLLIGTNTQAILPHNIAELMRFENIGQLYGDYEEDEETKE